VAGQSLVCVLLRPLADGLPRLLVVLGLGIAVAPALALIVGYLTPQDRATIRRLVPLPTQRRANRSGLAG
jgi:hypothetical protein